MKRIVLATCLMLAAAALTHPAPKSLQGAKKRSLECLNTDYPVETAPAIKIELSGFLLIRFDGCNRPCEIGIPREIGKHNLNIYVVKLQRGGTPEVVYSYSGPLKDSLWIGAFKPKYHGIHRYGMKSFDAARADDHDFGWAVDLEGPEYHNTALPWNAENMGPSIYIANGVFYCEGVTDPKNTVVIRKRPNGRRDTGYRRVATRISANIDFSATTSANSIAGFATLRFGQESQSVVKLDSDPTGATRYVIHIENDPLDPVHVSESDFKDYYRVLKNPLARKPYDFDFPSRATDHLPCLRSEEHTSEL